MSPGCRRSPRARLEHRRLFLTAGCDIQKDRFEIDVRAWGLGLESWLVDHIVIECGEDRTRAWAELTALLERTWKWQLRERNEALDCRVYARAAAWIAGVDRMPANAWSGVQQRANPPAQVQKPDQPTAPKPPSKPVQHAQALRPKPFKVRRSNWMTSGTSWFGPGR
jgi:phage terminase large subunit GpA-like protein